MALVKILDTYVATDKVVFIQEQTNYLAQTVTTLTFGNGVWLKIPMEMEKIVRILEDAEKRPQNPYN